MPAHHDLGSYEHEMFFPAWPESREGDPERAIERRKPGAGPTSGVKRKLLSKGPLDHNLICVTSEWRAKAAQKSDEEADEHPHGRSMLLEPGFRILRTHKLLDRTFRDARAAHPRSQVNIENRQPRRALIGFAFQFGRGLWRRLHCGFRLGSVFRRMATALRVDSP
jgi:hypothetical protein